MAISEEAKKRLLEAKQTVTNPTEQQSGFSASTQERLQAYKEWGAPVLQEMDDARRAGYEERKALGIDFTAGSSESGKAKYEAAKAGKIATPQSSEQQSTFWDVLDSDTAPNLAPDASLGAKIAKGLWQFGHYSAGGNADTSLPTGLQTDVVQAKQNDPERTLEIGRLSDNDRNEFYRQYDIDPEYAEEWAKKKIAETKANEAESMKAWAEEHPLWGNVASLAPLGATGADIMDVITDVYAGANHYDPFDPMTPTGISQTMREGAKAGSWFGQSGVGQFVDDVLYSSLQSQWSNVVGGGAFEGTGMSSLPLAFYSASAEARSLLQQGYDKREASILATGYGIISFITEAIGSDRIFDKAFKNTAMGEGFKQFGRRLGSIILKSMASEGVEEGAEDIADWVLEGIVSIINGTDHRTFSEHKANRLEEGKSDAEATALAIWDMFLEFNEDVLAGALSGGLMAGSSTAFAQTGELARNTTTAYQHDKKGTKGELVSNIKGIAEASGSDYANNIQATDSKFLKKFAENLKIGEAMSRANRDIYVGAIQDRLEQLGIPLEESRAKAEAIYRNAMGGTLSSKEKTLVNDELSKRVLGEIDDRAGWVYNAYATMSRVSDADTPKLTPEGAVAKMQMEQDKVREAYNSLKPLSEEDYLSLAQKYKDEQAISTNAKPPMQGGTNPMDIRSNSSERASQYGAQLLGGVRLANDGDREISEEDMWNSLSPNVGISAESLATAFAKRKEEVSLNRYANAVDLAYNYGKAGMKLADVVRNIGFSMDSALSEAYKNGQESYVKGLQNNKLRIDRKTANVSYISNEEATKMGVGTVDIASLSDDQNAYIDALDTISKAYGVKMVLFESNGNKNIENGHYDSTTNSIYIDVSSLSGLRKYAILSTAAHELVHDFRRIAPEVYDALRQFVIDKYYGGSETAFNNAAKRIMQQRKLQGFELASPDDAVEELVAMSCEKVFDDPNMISRLAETLESKSTPDGQTMLDKFIEWINGLIKRLKSALAKLTGIKANPYAEEMSTKDLEHIRDLFVQAARKIQSTDDGGLSESGIEYDAATDTAMMSTKDIPQNEEEITLAVERLSKKLGVTKAEAREWVESELSAASLILDPKFSDVLDYRGDRRYTAIKKNSDYPQGTLDFSNICRKRRNYTAMMQRLQKRYPNRVFTAEELAEIRQILIDNDIQVACGLCFVEDRRQNETGIAKTFQDAMTSWFAGERDSFNKNQTKALQMLKGGEEIPSIYELTTLEGMQELRAKSPNVADAWEKFNNARGMQSARLLQGEAEYKRQILQYKSDRVKRINNLGGLRVFSFSDFEEFHLIDIIQAIQDCAAMGLKIQGYTKVPSFAKLVMDTGTKVNRSLIPKGDLGYRIENGKTVLEYDTTEGIDINDPDFFDSTDNPNIGNILVGINDEQIAAAFLDPFVDYIIPFHTGQRADVLRIKKIGAWKNYKDYQEDKPLPGTTRKKGINIYTEVLDAAAKEGKPITNERQFVEKFLEVCKREGMRPRFSQFLNTDENGDYVYRKGYYKVLLDFKLFDKDGNILPQNPVKPIFDNEYINSILTRYAETKTTEEKTLAPKMERAYDEIENKLMHSFKGDSLSLGNRRELNIAKKMEEKGKDSESIRLATGWFKGMDGRWRYEIDDSDAKLNTDLVMPNGFIHARTYYDAEWDNLPSKIAKVEHNIKEITQKYGKDDSRLINQKNALRELKNRQKEIRDAKYRFNENRFLLTDILAHPALYTAYPQLKNVTVHFSPNTKDGAVGWASGAPKSNTAEITLALDRANADEILSTLMHEVQHIIQNEEGFARGSNIEYEKDLLTTAAKTKAADWMNAARDAENEAIAKEREYIQEHFPKQVQIRRLYGGDYEGLAKLIRNYTSVMLYAPEADYQSEADGILEAAKKYKRFDQKIFDDIQAAALDFRRNMKQADSIINNVSDEEARARYYRSAGETESRDVQSRLRLTETERENIRPDIDQTDRIVRFSTKDSEGNDLSENQQKYFADSVIRDKDGNLLLMHHGTSADFTEFDRNFIGQTGRFEGAGFNFTPSYGRASSYSNKGKVLSGYLNITKPLSATQKTMSVRQLANLIAEIDPTGDNIIVNYAQNSNDYPSKAFVRRESLYTARQIWDYAENDVDIYSEISTASPDSDSIIEKFQSMGYDGAVHYDDNGKLVTAIAFDSNQFKLQTNTNPTGKSDIRYSTKDIEMSPNTVKRFGGRVKDWSNEELERNYEIAAKEWDETRGRDSWAGVIVREAARRAGAISNDNGRPIKLYHGTPHFGFTEFYSNHLIYATVSSATAGNYGRGRYAAARAIGRKYDDSASPYTDEGVDAIIKNAKNVLGWEYHRPTEEDKQNTIDRYAPTIREAADKYADLYDALSPEEVEYYENLTDKFGDWFWNFNRFGYFWREFGDEFLEGDEEAVNWFHTLADLVSNDPDDIRRNGVSQILDDVDKNSNLGKLLRYIAGYDFGDALIDSHQLSAATYDPDNYIVSGVGVFASPRQIMDTTLARRDAAAYELYGFAKNVLEVGSGGRLDWASIPSDAIVDPSARIEFMDWARKNGRIHDTTNTDVLGMFAKQNGYDAVYVRNVSDGGEYADEYIFFSPEQIKSADPVTYDENGDIIPLSERFNLDNKDLRYSTKDSDGRTLTPEQQEYFKDSKVRDENGNLLVVYHGSHRLFTKFSGGVVGNFFARTFNVATGYAGNLPKSGIWNPAKAQSFETLNGYLDSIGVGLEHKNNKYIITEYDGETTTFGTLKEVTDYVTDQYLKFDLDNAAVYQVYLNITNPFVLDAKDQAWNSLPKNVSGASTTDDVAMWAKEHGYDGVVFKNVVDGWRWESDDVYVTFDANQQKDVKNKNPTSNPDIRYSIKYDDDGNLKVDGASGFSGGGTIDYMLRDIVSHVFAAEYDEDIAAVYEKNNGIHAQRDMLDIKTLEDFKNLPDSLEYAHFSPVCTNFSLANNKRGEAQRDIDFAKRIAEMIEAKMPKCITIEQVPAYAKSKSCEIIRQALKKLGYTFDEGIYNSVDFGGDMSRDRFFMRAIKEGSLPKIVKSGRTTKGWYDAIKDLIPSLAVSTTSTKAVNNGATKTTNYIPAWMKGRLDAMGVNYKNPSKPLFIMGTGDANGLVRYYPGNEPIGSVKAKVGEPKIILTNGTVLDVSPRVIARLMGIPDGYELPKSKTRAFKILGNGVPGQLSRAMAVPLIEEVVAQEGYAPKYSPKDSEYMELAQNPERNETELRSMLNKAAAKAGYTGRAYHGTYAFGRTSFDLYNALFLTDSVDVARNFSGGQPSRTIAKRFNPKTARLTSLIRYANENTYASDIRGAVREDIEEEIDRVKVTKTDIERIKKYYPSTWEEELEQRKAWETAAREKLKAYDEGEIFLYMPFNSIANDYPNDPLFDRETLENFVAKYATRTEGNGGVYDIYFKKDHMVSIDVRGAYYTNVPIPKELIPYATAEEKKRGLATSDQILRMAIAAGDQTVEYRNMREGGDYGNAGVSNVYAVVDSAHRVKSADLVTYDDGGNIIPLSERFNESNNDIRYSTKDEDEIPYGGKAYLTPERVDTYLKDFAIPGSPNRSRGWIARISPRDFWRSTSNFDTYMWLRKDTKPLNPDELKSQRQPIYFNVDLDSDGEPIAITGHEGRHRSMAMDNERIYQEPVILFDYDNWTDNRKEFSVLHLRGQGRNPLDYAVWVYDAIPLDYAHRDAIVEMFATPTKEEQLRERYGIRKTLQYSLKEDLSPNEYLASAVLENIRKPEDRAGLEEYLNRHKELYQETTKLSNEITDLENKLRDSSVLSDSDRESIENRIKALRKDVRENEKKMWEIVSKPRMQRIIEQQRATIQEYEEEMAKAEEKSEGKIAELRARMDTKVRAEIDKRIAMRKRMIEQQRTQRSRYYYLPRIEKVTKELRKNLEKAPMPFREPIADFLAALDTRTLDAQGNIKDNKANARKTNLIAALNNMSRIAGTTEEWLNKYNVDFNPEMVTWIDEMVEYLSTNRRLLDYYGDINLNTLSADMLEGVYKMVRSLNTTLKNLTKSYTNKTLDISEEAKAVMEFDGKLSHGAADANMAEKIFRWKNAQATTVYQRMGDGGWKMYKLLVKGQSKLAFNEQQIVDFAKSHWKPSDVRNWNKPKNAVAVEISGEKVMMTPAQMMALYATSRDADGLRHLLEGGGFKLLKQSSGNKMVVDVARHMTEMDLANVINALNECDPKLIKLTEEIQDFIGKVGAEWGNEVSVARFGYEQFGIENYFPLHTVAADKVGTVTRDDADAGKFWSMLNRSFTKERTFKANNALVIDGIFDIFANHMSQMALYNAYALPVLDTARFMNWEVNESVGGKPKVTTLGEVWDKAFGKGEMRNYLTNLLDSIAGAKRMDAFEAFALAGLRLHNRVAVAANFRVAAQQPFSITRAFDELDPKYFAKVPKNIKALQEEMWKNSGIALWKHQGNYDTNIKGSLTSQVMGAETGFGQFQDDLSEKAMWLAEKGDDFTWALIWNACKAYVSETQPTLTDKAYMDAVVSKFEDVVLLTQVVDTPLQKSEWMREKSFWFKMTSSFKSEPTTSYNMLLRTFDRLSEAKQSGKTGAVWAVVKGPMLRAFATYALTSLVNAMVTAVIDAARDDDDYETLLEKLKFAFIGDYRGKNVWQWITEFMGSNVGDSINPIKSLPWFSDIFSLAEGYDADRADLTIFEEILTQGKAIWTALTKGDMTYKKVFKLVDAFSKVIGIPFANVMRDVTAVWNTVFGRLDSTVKLQLSPETKQSGYNAFYYAIQSGETVKAMQIVDEIYSNEISSKTAYAGVTNVIRKAYQDGKIDKEDALDYMLMTNDYFGRGFDRTHIKNQVDGWSQE